MTTMVLASVFQLTLLLFISPLITGIIRTLKARLQTRRGPGVVQPYRDRLDRAAADRRVQFVHVGNAAQPLQHP